MDECGPSSPRLPPPHFVLWRTRWRTRRTSKHVFLRNEPTVFGGVFLCIILISRYLCRLQRRFAGGFVLENEPTGGVFLRGNSLKIGLVSGETKPLGSRDGDVVDGDKSNGRAAARPYQAIDDS